ncbi:MAG: hypothetical protein PHU36_02550, partial [Syntrophomonadaceae bacterium]|nr:hypothetical protein [Syntrophomonadaceae bacterium]
MDLASYDVITDTCFEEHKNQVFNHDFMFSNPLGNLPFGWQICSGSKTADFSLGRNNKHSSGLKIRNKTSHCFASICQQRLYAIPVYENQVWKLGAVLKSERIGSA